MSVGAIRIDCEGSRRQFAGPRDVRLPIRTAHAADAPAQARGPVSAPRREHGIV
jgi:hypothetical protein